MSCPNDGCKVRKIALEDKVICLRCGCQFRIEKIESESSFGTILTTLGFLAILFGIVTAFHQGSSMPYVPDAANVEVNSGK